MMTVSPEDADMQLTVTAMSFGNTQHKSLLAYTVGLRNCPSGLSVWPLMMGKIGRLLGNFFQ
jgi:hypothetical protein